VINGKCHCGAVSFQFQPTPEWLTQCNCSICRRLGGLWAHAAVNEIIIEAKPDATSRYIWGDKSIAFHSCRTCGCSTHWENLDQEDLSRMAVNMRLAEPADIESILIRRFDGADSWEFLD
jgi:hypothetical protein